MPILTIKNLNKSYPIQKGIFKRSSGSIDILKNINFTVDDGEILAIVGESGCGKSTLSRLIMGLEKPSSGSVYYKEQRIDNLSYRQQMPVRRAVQMVFQDPSSALNERFSVEKILHEPLDIHGIGTKLERREAVKNILAQVELPNEFLTRYPHELSGGQKQRVAIARSMILKPNLLLLDEPLSALDVSLQEQMITLFRKLQATFNLTIIMVSHDLGLVEEISDRTLVLNFGEIAELRETKALFLQPEHTYTKALLASIPSKMGKTRF